jgi:hypothetical protein
MLLIPPNPYGVWHPYHYTGVYSFGDTALAIAAVPIPLLSPRKERGPPPMKAVAQPRLLRHGLSLTRVVPELQGAESVGVTTRA